MMLANIASIEIPPINCTYLEWLQKQEASHLQRYGVKKETLHDRQFLPRILLGEYFRDQFLRLVDQARQQKFAVAVYESCQGYRSANYKCWRHARYKSGFTQRDV